MKIITFGSCLSRFTANSYTRLFGGKVISSVYHNRSDSFVKKFIDGENKIYEESEISKIFSSSELENSKTEHSANSIMKNQLKEHIGKHMLKTDKNFFEVLDGGEGNLIIMDNYIDLSARLFIQDKDPKKSFFLSKNMFNDNNIDWHMGDLLTVRNSVIYLQRVIDLFRSKLPNANIVFINFPHNTYAGYNELRVKRTKIFEAKFKPENVTIIPCMKVHKNNQTSDKQHFKPEQYAGYAGLIHQQLQNKGKQKILINN